MTARDVPGRLATLERLIHELEEGPESPARARARRLVQEVLDLHADALRRLLDALRAEPRSAGALRGLAADPEVGAVLLLHGLHPVGLEERAGAALDALAPVLRGHGARVAALVVAGGTVRVRVERDGGRPGPPAAALRARVEEALLAAAPDADAVDVDVPEAPAAFVPVERVRLRAPGAAAP